MSTTTHSHKAWTNKGGHVTSTAEHLLLFGPGVVGKTNRAIAIMMVMIEQDQACRLFQATSLVQLLQKAKASFELPVLIQKLDRYGLRVIVDISYSYVPCGELETWVLFKLIRHRYERRSLLVTSNQPFREWHKILPSGSMTVTVVDPLVHHCHIVGIVGIEGERSRQKQLQRGFLATQRPRLRN